MVWKQLVQFVARALPRRSRPLSLGERRGTQRHWLSRGRAFLSRTDQLLPLSELSLSGCSIAGVDLTQAGLQVGDLLAFKLRAYQATATLTLRVTRLDTERVGCSFHEKSVQAQALLQRILKPYVIGTSLHLVDGSVLRDGSRGRTWLRGDRGTDLYLWRQRGTGALLRWEAHIEGQVCAWSASTGITSWTVAKETALPQTAPTGSEPGWRRSDLVAFVADMVSSVQHPCRDAVLESLLSG